MKSNFTTNKTTIFSRPSFLPALLMTFWVVAAPALAEIPLEELTVLRRNNVRQLILLNACRGCDLAGITLVDAHLMGADLRDANLRFATLAGSNLEGADLSGADLTGANLTGTFLTNASLANAQLESVNFSDAHLYYVDVEGAAMNNLILTGAQVVETPIYVGGEEQPPDEPPASVMPFEEINPAESYEPLLTPDSVK